MLTVNVPGQRGIGKEDVAPGAADLPSRLVVGAGHGLVRDFRLIWSSSSIGASTGPVRSTGGFAAPGDARQASTLVVPGGPARIVGTYSSSWRRPSKVRLLIISSATSG